MSTNLGPRSTSHRVFLASISLLALSLGCSSDPNQPPPSDAAPAAEPWQDQEFRVYAAALLELSNARLYVFVDHTMSFLPSNEQTANDAAIIAVELDQMSADTQASFWARNGGSYPMPPEMTLGVPFTLINLATEHAMFSGADDAGADGWQQFYNKYPDASGMHILSRVGFSEAGDQALVYVRWQGAWLAGWGKYVLLQKSLDTWVVTKVVMTLIS